MREPTFKIAVIILMFSGTTLCQVRRQIEIPLSNKSGVPFEYVKWPPTEKGYYVGGFDVGADGNLYFLGWNPVILVKATPHGKILFRKTYTQFSTRDINIVGNLLYVFDKDKKALFVINPDDGSIIREYQNILKGVVNDYFWNDSTLVVWIMDKQRVLSENFDGPFVKFGVHGEYLGKTNNIYGLPDSIYGTRPRYGALMGKTGGDLIYGRDEKPGVSSLWAFDSSGYVVGKVYLSDESIGQVHMFLGTHDGAKLRNGNIYFLGRKGKNAVVTEIPAENLFRHQRK